jgi:hypothetical protein
VLPSNAVGASLLLLLVAFAGSQTFRNSCCYHCIVYSLIQGTHHQHPKRLCQGGREPHCSELEAASHDTGKQHTSHLSTLLYFNWQATGIIYSPAHIQDSEEIHTHLPPAGCTQHNQSAAAEVVEQHCWDGYRELKPELAIQIPCLLWIIRQFQ